MKKLMVMMGAVATALGLFAADPVPYSNSFEANDDGVSDGAFKPSSDWTWNGESPMTLKTDGAGRVLPYTAAGTPMARRTFNDGTTNDNYLPLETGNEVLERKMNGNVFVDQLVQFTGFEEPLTQFADGTKIAVWMSAIEADDTVEPAIAGETNLYVSVGKEFEGKVTVTNLIVDVDATGKALPAWQTDKWYRLTIKSLGDIYGGAAGTTPRAGFIVYIDGVQVASSDQIATALIEMDTSLTQSASSYMAKGALFPSFGTGAVAEMVGYKGIGAIDDLYLDSEGPKFVQVVETTIKAIEGATVSKVVVTGSDPEEIVEHKDGKIEVAPGTRVTIHFVASGNYMLNTTTFTTTVYDGTAIDASSAIKPAKVVAYVNDTIGCTNFVQALEEVQKLEVGEYEIGVNVVEDADEAVIPEKGTFDFVKGTFIAVTPGCWTVMGEGKLLASIDANNTVICQSREIEGSNPLTGKLTYSGTVAGTLKAETITLAEGGKITLTNEGQVITTSELTGADFTVPEDYEFHREDGTGDYEGYTIYTAVPAAPKETGFAIIIAAGETTTTNYYPTLDAAIAAAGTDGLPSVVTILADATLTETVVITKAVTLNLNGKTLSCLSDITAIKVDYPSADLTISNGCITVDEGYCVWARQGNVTIVDGTFTNDSNDNYAIYAGGGVAPDYLTSKVTILGGTFVNNNADPYLYNPALSKLNLNVQNGGKGVIEVRGGSFTSDPAGGDDSTVPATFVADGYASIRNGDNWNVGAAIIATFMVDDAVYAAETNIVAFTPATPTDPSKEGYTFNGWTPTIGEISKSTVFVAQFEADQQKVDPEQPITPPQDKDAQTLANEMNTKGIENYLKVPDGVTEDAYTAMFEAKAVGDKVIIDLKTEVETAIKAELANTDTSDSMLKPDAKTSEVTITARPGLFYGIKAVDDVTKIGAANGKNWVQAKGATVKVVRPPVGGDAAFFQAVCTPKDPRANQN